jgi:hypothetical protein
VKNRKQQEMLNRHSPSENAGDEQPQTTAKTGPENYETAALTN